MIPCLQRTFLNGDANVTKTSILTSKLNYFFEQLLISPHRTKVLNRAPNYSQIRQNNVQGVETETGNTFPLK